MPWTDESFWLFSCRAVGIGLGLVIVSNWWVWHRKAGAPTAWNVPWPAPLLRTVCLFWLGWVLGWLKLSGLLFGLVFAGTVLDGRTGALLNLFGYLLGVVASGMVLLQALIWRKYPSKPQGLFSFKCHPGWWQWGLGGYLSVLPALVAASWLNHQALRWLGNFAATGVAESWVSAGSDLATAVIVLVTVCLVAPLFEELFFRGFVFTTVASRWGWMVGAGSSSVLFAAAHLRPESVLPLFTLGFISCVVYHRTRSLAASVLLHSLFNFGSFFSLMLVG